MVCDLGGTVTLSVSADRYVLSWDLGDGQSQSHGGHYLAYGEGLEFTAVETGGSDRVGFRFGPREMSFSSEESGWDFDGTGGEEPASFVAVFVRL